MSEKTPTGPVMDGSDDAGDDEKRAGLIEQVDHDHRGESAGAAEDDLRGRLEETGVEPEH